jgi:spore coat polysaccharide biosynthesis protein SpsF
MIGAIIQARSTSSRLPKKVLKPLPFNSSITVLEQVIRRVKKSKLLDEIIVATTESDKEIVEIAKKENVKYFIGDEKDVLSRYYFAAKENNLDTVVRITSDCPCIDWELIDKTIEKFLKEKIDYISNTTEGKLPRGLDVEVLTFKALEKAYLNAKEKFEREHVTPYIYNNKDKFKISFLSIPDELSAPDIRITLDTEEDYALLCIVFDELYYKNPFFKTEDIIKLFKEKPYLKLINKKVMQKKTYFNMDDEIKAAEKLLEMQELNNAKNLLKKCYGNFKG